MPRINWMLYGNNSDNDDQSNLRDFEKKIVKVIYKYGLSQRNFIKNSNGTYLDLVLCPFNFELNVIKPDIVFDRDSVHHYPYLICIPISTNVNDLTRKIIPS